MKGAKSVRQTYEKVLLLEIFSLGLSILLSVIALFQGSAYLLIISCYLLVISLACDAYSHEFTSYRQFQGKKQLARAIILFFIATALIFQL